jgi:outer membrane receptor protein involved in Fe transport
MLPILMVAVLLIAGRADAQTNCDDALTQAQKTYDLGIFADVPAQLAPCLTAAMPRRVAIDVHRLLALTYIYDDQPELARREVSTILRLDSTFAATSPAQFAKLVRDLRQEQQVTQVASVSKTSESLREAPATVVVVTSDEIHRRGYLDLEQLLHDLPGFDLSRTNGDIYSFINLRGYRSDASDRLLFLVDGVEQNDLSTNTLYLSRQYPLSNIDRVEVVYGPASTMYGANAYTGVISIITKQPEGVLGEDKLSAIVAQATAGGYGGGSLDLTLAGRNPGGTIAWSVAGNFQQSKERDLSGFDAYDYTYRNFDYAGAMRLSGADADAFIAAGKCAQPSAYFECNAAQSTVELTPAGVSLVRGLDQKLISESSLGFDDRARNWAVNGQLRISNLTLGLQSWRSQEGTGSSNLALLNAGSDNWTPRETAVYLKYSIPLEKVKLNLFSRYEQTSLERENTVYHYLHSYARGTLNVWSLVEPCEAPAPADEETINCAPAGTWSRKANFGTLSTQLRSELNLTYEPSAQFNGVAGIELAKSSFQSTFDQVSTLPLPRDPALDGKPEQVEHTDLAVFAQTSYRPRPWLRTILAGRLSHNAINNKPGTSGFGTLFTPRAGLIFTPGRKALMLKAIYSEAFKDPTDYQKFGKLHFINDFPLGDLEPEKVRNIELSAGWEPSPRFSAEAALYQAHYTNVVSAGLAPDCDPNQFGCDQYQNRDENLNRGAQFTARYQVGFGELWGNYTHTDAYKIDPTAPEGGPLLDEQGNVVTRIRQADIAANRLTVGVDADWTSRLSTSLRLRYAGDRPTGPGTTQPDSPLQRIDAYAIADAVFNVHLQRDLSLQLIVNNILDEQYAAPTTFPTYGPASVLQAGRTFYVRFAYGMPSRRAERAGSREKGGTPMKEP